MTVVFSDNFDSDTLGSIAPGWTAKTGTWTVGTTLPVSGGQSFGPTTKGDGDVALYTGSGTLADMSVFYSQKFISGSKNPSVSILLRSDAAFSNAYGIIFSGNSGVFTITGFKRVSGSYTFFSNASGPTISAGATISVRAQIVGTSIQFRMWDASGAEPGTWQANYTDSSITAAGYCGLYNSENTLSGVAMAIDDFALSNFATVAVAANDAGIAYSPGNWDVTSSRALSINAGAYFSTMFSGSSLALNFNVANLGTPASEIYYRIDGYEAQSPWTKANVAGTITTTMPSDTSAFPWHLLEVVIKSTSEAINRWNSPSATAVLFTGLTLAGGASVMAPGNAANGSILFFGDSITEGVRTVNQTAANDTDRNDAMMGWAYAQRRLLGVEVGIIGFGGSGLTVTGSGNVPVLSTSYASIMSGVARGTSVPNLKLIVLNEGTNDNAASDASVTSAMTTALNNLLTAYPGVPIAVLRPFGGYKASALQAGIAACSSPANVRWIDTTGFMNSAYGIDTVGYHPSGPNNLGIIAPLVAAALKPLLGSSSASGIHRTGSRGGLR